MAGGRDYWPWLPVTVATMCNDLYCVGRLYASPWLSRLYHRQGSSGTIPASIWWTSLPPQHIVNTGVMTARLFQF